MQTLSVGRDLKVNNDELKLMTESFQFHGARSGECKDTNKRQMAELRQARESQEEAK